MPDMGPVALHVFIAEQRNAIIRRCVAKVATRAAQPFTAAGTDHGVPLFLEQLITALRLGLGSGNEIGPSAILHGHDLLRQGFSVSQVVHGYGDICQAISELAMEAGATISVDDFRLLNQCLDDATSGAVTQFGREHTQSGIDGETARGTEYLGFLAHELGNLTQTAMLAFGALKTGNLAASGSTGDVLHQSLIGIRALIGRSLAEVRLARRFENRERFDVSTFIQELAPAATLAANARGIRLTVLPVDDGAAIEGDRQVLAAVVSNLLQNAFKFTQPLTTVTLRVGVDPERVRIEVQDECGGLPDGTISELFRPFEQRGVDRSGLGLGLAFSRQAVEANDGHISAHNLSHHEGCVFTVNLPRLAMPVTETARSFDR
jgi:signal transduction histidine kinase